jgi:hypothetical protein
MEYLPSPNFEEMTRDLKAFLGQQRLSSRVVKLSASCCGAIRDVLQMSLWVNCAKRRHASDHEMKHQNRYLHRDWLELWPV